MCKLQRLVFYPEQPFEIPTQTQTILSTQSSALKRTLNMCSLDPGSCSLVTQACNMDTRIQSHPHTHILSPTHKHTHTSHPHRAQQSPLGPTHLMFFPYYVQMDMHNCAGVVCCFCWRLSTAPMKSPTEAIIVAGTTNLYRSARKYAVSVRSYCQDGVFWPKNV